MVLLDTNVASLLHPRKARSAEYRLYRPLLVDRIHAVGFQTVAEFLFWPEASGWGRKACADLDEVIKDLLVLPYDRSLAESWATFSATAKKAGRRLESGDAWIAATALRYGLQLLTHDRDLADRNIVGLNVVCLAP